jgi:hypothetical protein
MNGNERVKEQMKSYFKHKDNMKKKLEGLSIEQLQQRSSNARMNILSMKYDLENNVLPQHKKEQLLQLINTELELNDKLSEFDIKQYKELKNKL